MILSFTLNRGVAVSAIPLFVKEVKKIRKKLSDSICILFVTLFTIVCFCSVDCFAVGETSRADYPVANGITESTVYVTVNGKYNVRTHILRIAPDAGASFKASYGGYYGADIMAADRKKAASTWGEDDWSFKSVREQSADYEASPDSEGEVIAASNGDFYDIATGKPEGCLVMEGKIIRKSSKRPFFAVLKNGNIVIRKAGGSTGDVEEAVGGRDILVWDGKVRDISDGLRNPREAIGICKDGTVVLVNVDGREPASAGVTLKEMGSIMKAQGCRKALNLDGGGSASFMTRRVGDDELEFRSNHSDGPERSVASALLILGGSSVYDEEYRDNVKRMESSSTCLSEDENGLVRYKINGKNQSGFFAVNGESYLFSKGKGITAKVRIGNSTYRFSGGRLKKCSDSKAGNVIIGYCGGKGKTGKNLLYAYHDGDKILKIGLNPLSGTKSGNMKNWDTETIQDIPWYAARMDIKRVYIGNGVTNIGGYFLYSTNGYMPGGAEAPKCRLSSVRLPLSLKEIGVYSFYNKPKLRDVKLPSGVKKIGKAAFRHSGKGTLTFKGKTPPEFGKASVRDTGFKTILVKQSKAWKKFVRQKKFRNAGYKKTVKYY